MDRTALPGRTTLAKVPQTGSVWGTAYDTKTDALFAAASYKRHSGLGPLGVGGIYRVSDVLTAAGLINSGATVSSWKLRSSDGLSVIDDSSSL